MAEKDKVPVVAIRQIVKMRSDEYHNYSYRAIAEHLKSEFGIDPNNKTLASYKNLLAINFGWLLYHE